MYTLQTRILLYKVSKISIFIFKLIQLYPVLCIIFYFLKIVKSITRMNESSNGYIKDSYINFENSLARARERNKFKDTSLPDFVEGTAGSLAEDLITNNLR